MEKQFNLTDLGNAERLQELYGDIIRYVPAWRKWFLWTGKHWKETNQEKIHGFAQKTIRNIPANTQKIEEIDLYNQTVKHLKNSESQTRIRNMCEALKSLEGIILEPHVFDTDSMLLNLENGVLNLETGNLIPHNKELYITKLAPVEFDLTATCPVFLDFLNDIMLEDQALVEYLQRCFGYALTGSIKEQVLFFLIGTGANGKSTLLSPIQELLGDYAQQAPSSMIIKNQHYAIPNDIARLKGARLAVIAEVERNEHLAEAKIKQLTGGDVVTARFMRAEFFEFKPECKIFIMMNQNPEIMGSDDGIWRRLHFIPFKAYIPAKDRDKDLGQKLKNEASGILNWLLKGCKDWQAQGLNPPEAIISSVIQYRESIDDVGAFLKACCDISEDSETPSKALYEAYLAWCTPQGKKPLTQKSFGLRLADKGFTDRKSSVKIWTGLALKSSD